MITPAMPPPDANRQPSGSFRPAWFGDAGEPTPDIPQDAPFTEGEGPGVGLGDVPANIYTGGPGPISRSKGKT